MKHLRRLWWALKGLWFHREFVYVDSGNRRQFAWIVHRCGESLTLDRALYDAGPGDCFTVVERC